MRAFALQNDHRNAQFLQDPLARLAGIALGQQRRPLGDTETAFARTAWAYFSHFTDHQTGFAPATNRQTTLSPWEMGATLMAITAAARLNLISARAAAQRISHCLDSLADLPLDRLRLPGNRYCVRTLNAVDHEGRKIRNTLGWTARSIMRLIAGFIVTAHHFPALAPEISLILNRWRLDRLLDHGRFCSASWSSSNALEPTLLGNTFLGHEQYAARTACLVNLPADTALDPARSCPDAAITVYCCLTTNAAKDKFSQPSPRIRFVWNLLSSAGDQTCWTWRWPCFWLNVADLNKRGF